MSEIQSLSLCCPAHGHCINNCKTCTARQHSNPYKDKYNSTFADYTEYWRDVIKRMKYALSKGCTTLMLTGSNEPQQNRQWLKDLYLAMESLPEKFYNIEIQTTGAKIDEEYLRFLKELGVTTMAISTFNIFSDMVNRDIEGNADSGLSLQTLCDNIHSLGMNVRICANVTDYIAYENPMDNAKKLKDDTEKVVQKLLGRCAELHANQVTFRKMWCAKGTPEEQWINANCEYDEKILAYIEKEVKENGVLLGKLPYGALRYDYKGFSIVVDSDSMAKDTDNGAIKYYIIRENGKMYSSWDSPASIIF